MMIEQHYDEEVLIALLDEQAPDPHLQSCATCKASLNSIRQVTSALHDETVWDRRELHEEPRPETRNALSAFATSAAREDAAAEPWVKALLAKPASAWRAMVDAHPEWHTAGFVRKLIAAVDAINFTAPTDAMELTKIAVDVADALEGTPERLAKLRASAWREYGYALNYVGSHFEAINAYENCYKLLESVAFNEYEIARVQLFHAQPLSSIERTADAMRLVRTARATFLAYGDQRRATIATMTEGGVLKESHQYSDALAVNIRVMNDDTVDDVTRACALHNGAVCCLETGELGRAKELFVRAIDAYDRLGLPAFRAKSRWSFAAILLREGDYDSAITVFRSVRAELEDLGLSHSVALVCLDLSEALLLNSNPQEVADLCNSAMAYFRAAQLAYTEGALTALAYLREASQAKMLTINDLTEVRAFFEILPKQPELLFARPA